MFVRLGAHTVGEFSLRTQALRPMAVPADFDGLAYSSSLGSLFGVTHEGLLYAMDPDTGAVLPGYPISMAAYGQPVAKTGALAADEAVDERCNDGDACTVDCCGGPVAACSHAVIPGCVPEDCGNCLDDDLDGRTDLEDADCCPHGVRMRAIRSRLSVRNRARHNGRLRLRSAFTMGEFNPLADDLQVHVRGGTQLLCAIVPHGQWRRRPSRRFVFRGNGLDTSGLTKVVIRARPNGEIRFRMAGTSMDMTRYTKPELGVTVGIGARCSTGTLQMREQKTSVITFRSR
jgi:hypothetical protein